MVSRGASEVPPSSARAYYTLSDKMYALEARSVRAAEDLHSAMASWGGAPRGDRRRDGTTEPDAGLERELKARLEEEMTLWQEENGWSATMPEQDRQELIRSIRGDLEAKRRTS